MAERTMGLVVFVIYDESGLDGVKWETIERELGPLRPDYLEFMGGRACRIALKCRAGSRGRARAFRRVLAARVLGRAEFRNARIGSGAGRCVCGTDVWGRLTSLPWGGAAYRALYGALR